jgi:UDP-2,3-diacylglucosamine hydrolase
MKAIFLSDAHLKREKDENYQRLLHLFETLNADPDKPLESHSESVEPETVQRVNPRIDHLFILGDFFDFWFSRGSVIYPEYRVIVRELAALKQRGVTVHFLEGNHDFFLADYFTRRLGLEVLTDWGEWHDGQRRILFSHGDTVDLQNRKYLFLRRVLRSRAVYRLQKVLPLSMLWAAARISSEASQGRSREQAERLAEKMHAFAAQKIGEGFDAVVLGHCHHPRLREWSASQGKVATVTLGDWIKDFSYLYYAEGRFQLLTEPSRT